MKKKKKLFNSGEKKNSDSNVNIVNIKTRKIFIINKFKFNTKVLKSYYCKVLCYSYTHVPKPAKSF